MAENETIFPKSGQNATVTDGRSAGMQENKSMN